MSSHQLFLLAGSEAFSCTVVYTSGSGTETPPVGATTVEIHIIGGGGGGNRNSTLATSRGGGGGAHVKWVVNVGGNSFEYSVGTFGTGRVSSAGSGTNGTASTVSVGFADESNTFFQITSGGGNGAQTGTNGAGGVASESGNTVYAGGTRTLTNGVAGTAGDGDLGGKGGNAGQYSNNVYSGLGGNNSPALNTMGVAGSNYGGGGGGGAAANGSNGAGGVIVFIYS